LLDREEVPIFVGSGDVLVSRSGRLLSPVPMLNVSTSRQCTNAVRRLDDWLLMEARAEASALRDGWGALLLSSMKAGRLSLSDRDHLNLYLFSNSAGAGATNLPARPRVLTGPNSEG